MGNEQMENTVPKIYAAILGVMNEVGAVSKEKTCKSNFGSYKFRGIDDVMNALHPAMVKNRVFALSRKILEMTREVKTSAKGTPMTSSICKVRYDFFTDDGSKVSCTVIGEGMDTGDKATNKAMSIAFKYACFQTFCIPTEDMDDPDAERPEETADQRTPGTETKAGQKRKKQWRETEWKICGSEKGRKTIGRGNTGGWESEDYGGYAGGNPGGTEADKSGRQDHSRNAGNKSKED